MVAVVLSLICPASEASTNPEKLVVTPKICAVNNNTPYCDVSVFVQLIQQSSDEVCLFENDKVIQCWQEREINYHHKASIQFDTVYLLSRTKQGVVLDTVKAQVQNSQLKPQRRRLRSPWSFF